MQKLIIFILGKHLNFINLISKRIGGKLAFLLFCYPFPLKLKPAQMRFFKTSKESFEEFEGKKIAVYEWGSGPSTILCLHGWQSQSYRWKKFVELLDKKKYTIIAIDAPAHGKSEGSITNVPMYARLIEQLMVKFKADFILAHSIGAFSSMCLFYEKPELSPKKMALLGTPGEALEFVEEYARILGSSDKVMTNLICYFKAYAGKDLSYYSTIRFAAAQRAKCLLIHDLDDREAPYAHAFKVHEVWPNSELMTTKGLGHKLRDVKVVDRVISFFG
ncbi:alpha/beta hydrolase [Bacteroidia bacterium]|nr:alpha/beta hydrolase [Bacteroidia bacterium]MDB4107239.1 alpha/beta hydrolase [Bacteroidia bacterium]MDB9883154.1 alpha/beta hydrolase [Bacteroidia bacterium]